MGSVTIRLLGGFSLTSGADRIEIATPRLQALLAYLIVHRDTPQARQRLAFLFWPDSSESQARTNLRRLLHHLRAALPDADGLVRADGPALAWSGPGASVDVVSFEDALARAAAAKSEGAVAAEREALEGAVRHYGGDLLPASYDEWLLSERARLRDAFTVAAERLLELLEGQERYKEAVGLGERLRRHDPLHEPSYRALMRVHAADGDRAAAVRVFHACVSELDRALGVEPDPETRRAYEALIRAPEPPTRPEPTASRSVSLVGRRAELERLRAAWAAAMAGATRLVLVSGEAGVGKTRLAEELAVQLTRDGYEAARARVHAAEGRLAYAPVVDWLRSTTLRPGLAGLDDIWLVELARLLPEVAAERPDLPSPGPLTEAEHRGRLFEGMARVVTAGPTPLLLVLDDLQWCDRETLEWIHYLVRFDAPKGVLLVGTARSHDIDSLHPLAALLHDLRGLDLIDELDVAPLNSDETVQLARRLAEAPLHPDLEQSLYRQTGGIPLFVVESVQAGLPARSDDRSGPGAADAGRGRDGLPPPRIRSVIQSRLEALSPGAQELAQLAAVVGREFTLPVLAEANATGEDELVESLDELWRHRIVCEHGGEAYDFAHDLLRAVAYAQVGPVLRRMLHRRVAHALEAVSAADLDLVAGEVALHYDLAGSPEPAVDAYLRGAEAAQRMFALGEVERLLRRGLELVRDLPTGTRRTERELALHTALGVCLVAVDGYGSIEVRREFAAATELCDTLGRPASAPILRGLAISSVAQADPRTSFEVGCQLLALAESGDDPLLHTEANYVLGVSCFWLGDFADARRHLEAAMDTYSERHHHEHVTLYSQDAGVVCLSRLGYVLWYLGEEQRAREVMADALALGERLGHPFSLAYALNYAAWLAHDAGDTAAFRRCVGALGALAEEHPIGFFEYMRIVFEGRLETLAGDAPQGIAGMEDGLARYHATGQDLHRPYGLALLATARLESGALEPAAEAVDEALELGRRTGEHFLDAHLHRLRGEIVLAIDPAATDRADAEFSTAIDIARAQGGRALERRAIQSRGRLLARA